MSESVERAWLAHRFRPTALDLAVSLAERKRVFHRLHPNAARQGGDRKSANAWVGSRARSFLEDTRTVTGFSKGSIIRYVRIGERLAPEAVRLLWKTKLAKNGRALLRLSEHEPHEQIAIAKAIAEGRAASLDEACALLPAKAGDAT